jgi:AraC family transcriptional regulator, transcriptional activator of pobA
MPTQAIVINRFLAHIQKMPTLLMSVDTCAAELDICPQHLNRICQERLQKSPYSLIQVQLIETIKYQLLHSDKKIKEIAFDLGFRSSAHFCTYFKRNTGECAKAFRINNQC